VVVGCDAIGGPSRLRFLAAKLAAQQIPFGLAIEGQRSARSAGAESDLEGYSTIILANPLLLSDQARQRVRKLAENDS